MLYLFIKIGIIFSFYLPLSLYDSRVWIGSEAAATPERTEIFWLVIMILKLKIQQVFLLYISY